MANRLYSTTAPGGGSSVASTGNFRRSLTSAAPPLPPQNDFQHQQYQMNQMNDMYQQQLQQNQFNPPGFDTQFQPPAYHQQQQYYPISQTPQPQIMNGLDSSFQGIPPQMMQDEFSPSRSLFGGRSTNTGGYNDEDIDSKIMENVQKYLSQFMGGSQGGSVVKQGTSPYPQAMAKQQYGSPQMPQSQAQRMYQSPPKHMPAPQYSSHRHHHSPGVNSEEYLQLRSVIEGLTSKIDKMHVSTQSLQSTLDAKDRELNRMKQIHQIRLQTTPTKTWDSQHQIMKARKKEKACQTVVNMAENNKEYETYSYLYDKDQDLLKSEKHGLMKYLRKEVVQNQEFLDRISELEGINGFLMGENEGLRRQLGEAQLYIEQLEASQHESEEESQDEETTQQPLSIKQQSIRIITLEQSVDCCELLNLGQLEELRGALFEAQGLNEALQEQVRGLKVDLQGKDEEIEQLKEQGDTQVAELKEQIEDCQRQLQEKSRLIGESNHQIDSLKRELVQGKQDLQALQTELAKRLKDSSDELSKIKQEAKDALDKLTQEKDKLHQLLRAKDTEVWDLEKELEQKTTLIVGLEEAQNKKNKSKKASAECMNCLKKDSELAQLKAKIEKVSQENFVLTQDYEKQIRQKDNMNKENQSLIDNLQKQIAQGVNNLIKGGQADPTVKIMVEKLEKENGMKDQMIEQLKVQMSKQAEQFMQAMMQQQATMLPPPTPPQARAQIPQGKK
ncbi:hypothetical protein FGO68_gene1439 [Halteria grandinella]|uniref:Uncharacterized protein n=1 Tax=Halteria grandinella TaxID=5974 RepID=A0A8J8P2W1_HALGN|nr:hypothetical protein FGO68_gene1439 [Halteria grandinella]